MYEYTDAGLYTVSFIATNAAGSNTTTKSEYINVTSIATPIASFTADIRKGTLPLSVQFTDTSSNSPTSWVWLFGDGTESTLENPLHTYTSAGTYTVELTAANAGGSRTTTASWYITVTDETAAPTATPVYTQVTAVRTTVPATAATAVMIVNTTLVQSASGGISETVLIIGALVMFAVSAAIFLFVKRPGGGSHRSRRGEL